MIKNILKHLLVFLLIKLPLQLVGYPILALALLFISEDKEVLPKFLRWFDNHEMHLREDGNDGLSGPPSIRNKFENPRGWLARFSWLAIRNPINYFQHKYLGFVINEDFRITKVKGDLTVGTHDWNTRGYYYQEAKQDGKSYWELYIVYPLFKDYHFRFRAGWKIGGAYSSREVGDSRQWVFAVTPLKKLD